MLVDPYVAFDLGVHVDHGNHDGVRKWDLLCASVPQPHILDLEQAWPQLQFLTRPASHYEWPRPCYRLFQTNEDIYQLDNRYPWIRVILPDELKVIAADLATVTDSDVVRLAEGESGHRSQKIQRHRENWSYRLYSGYEDSYLRPG